MNRKRYRRIKFKRMVATHKPHIFATGAILSAVATAAGMAAGVVQFNEVFGRGVMLTIATAVFVAAFFGTILLKRNK